VKETGIYPPATGGAIVRFCPRTGNRRQ